MQWNGKDIAAPPQEMHLIRMKGNSGDALQQNKKPQKAWSNMALAQ